LKFPPSKKLLAKVLPLLKRLPSPLGYCSSSLPLQSGLARSGSLETYSARINATSGWCHAVAGGVFVAILSRHTESEHFSWELKLFLVAVGISAILGRWQRIIDMRSPVLPKAFEEDMPLFWVRHMKREEVINYLGGLLAKHIPARHISKIKAQAKSQEHRWFESTFWRGMLVGYQLIVLVVACLIFGFWMIWMHLVGRYHRLWLPACTITPKSGRGETALRRGMPTLRSGLVGVNYAVSRKSKSCGRRPLDNFKASIVESYGLRTDEAV
jgi:hypothetical protein